jgi:alpha-tubulin suppressor-like RCC1 family protein
MIATRVVQTAVASGSTAGTMYGAGANTCGELGPGDTGKGGTFVNAIGRRFTAVAAGSVHTLGLAPSGQVFAWGDNNYGQLGDGTKNLRTGDIEVPSLDSVIAIAAGNEHNVALMANGGVRTWGRNHHGQLGDGTTTDRYSPAPVPKLNDIVAIAAGGDHTLALRSDGKIMAWGRNDSGELGDGTTDDRHLPVLQNNLEYVAVIATGLSHSLALLADGTVWAWGANHRGQLGDQTKKTRLVPVHVESYAIAIDGGSEHSLVLRGNGVVRATGRNDFGQLGDGTVVDRHHFDNVMVREGDRERAFADVIAVAAGWDHNVALKADGTAHVWGCGNGGRLGVGSEANKLRPFGVALSAEAERVTAIAAGMISTLLLCRGRSPWQWGSSIGPEEVGLVPNDHLAVKAVAAGSAHGLALLVGRWDPSGGRVWSWGNNASGQLGRTGQSESPGEVEGLSNVVAIACGDAHNQAVTSTGTVKMWGKNLNGQLGDNHTTDRYLPDSIVLAPGQTPFIVSAVAAGAAHSLALAIDGKVWAWGANDSGQLGDGTTTERHLPVLVHNLDHIIAIAAGDAHSLALRADGTVWSWGANDDGQLGNNTATSSTVPVSVLATISDTTKRASGIKAISAGGAHSLALRTTGTVLAWGRNDHGQVGDGSGSPSRPTAVQVVWAGPGKAQYLAGVKAIAAGSRHSLALVIPEGNVYGWGANATGELGDPTSGDKKAPDNPVQGFLPPDEFGGQELVPLAGFTAISCRDLRSVAIKAREIP